MTARELTRVLGWNVLLIVAGLLIVEAVFGGWFRGGGLGMLHVPRDVELRHDVSRVQPGGGIALYRRDRWGLRGSHADPAQIAILAVGGSTTNELYHDESQTWTAVLQKQFAASGRPIAVGNAGIDGHSTVGHLRSMEAWFPRIPGLEPGLIVFYAGINDVHLAGQAHHDAILPQGTWEKLRRYAGNNSALVGLTRTVRGMIRARRVGVVYGHAPPRLVAVARPKHAQRAPHAAALAAYGARIAALADRARALGARPVFVTQRRGDVFRSDSGWLATGPEAVAGAELLGFYNDAMLDACRAADALCIDLAREIDLRPEDFVDSFHTTVSGSRKIGEFLHAKLKDAL